MEENWLLRQLDIAAQQARLWPAWRRKDCGGPELWLDAQAVHNELRRAAREPETSVAWEVHSSVASRAEKVLKDTFRSLPGIDLDCVRIDFNSGITVFVLKQVRLTDAILEASSDLYIAQTAHLLTDIVS